MIRIKPLPLYWRLADKLMTPIMFVLRGLKFDSLQETHPWHGQLIDPADVDLTMAAEPQSRSASTFTYQKGYFLFHAPIFGGWKQFTVLEVDSMNTPFHIGWIVRDAASKRLVQAAVHRLPIHGTRIRMLDGPASYHIRFFAVTQDGLQIPVQAVGHGQLNDGQYLSVRLF